jgi:MOSC domain-containing protein YiiM
VDGITAETCSEWGFDARHWRIGDAGTLLAALGYWWRLATEGVTAEDLNRRPATGVWSVLEYGRHTSLVTAIIRGGIEKILAEDGCVLPAPPHEADADADHPARLNLHQVLDELEREGARLAALPRQRSAAWANVGHLPGQRVQAAAALLHAAHDASHHVMDVAWGLAAIGAATPAATGTLTRVNLSGGGVPKLPIEAGHITWRGLVGDRQADSLHHGRPSQALCLWSAEVISELSAAGHPVEPGSAGENLTLSGIDWASLRPGTRMRSGTAMVELSYPAIPCTKLATCFADGKFGRISHDRNPHRARGYAWVRQPGDVKPGSAMVVQP